MQKKKIVLAISGASGSVYARQLLELLTLRNDCEVALVMSRNARSIWEYELGNTHYLNYKHMTWETDNYNAPFASGSSRYEKMIIAPCSMGTLGRIASGISDSLITRAADVMLKERRTLICLVRETPYSLIHIQQMKTVSEAGGIICPATPSFYSRPQDIESLIATVTHRVLSLAGLDHAGYRWGEEQE